MRSDLLTLNWNSFESNYSSSLATFRENGDFYDVTLACDDDQIQCHKIVLSACSPFFLHLLRRNPHPHPLVYLKGVSLKHLLSLVEFMYHGQVNVTQECLTSFMAVAADLKVKGLAPDVSNDGQKDISSPVQLKMKNTEKSPIILSSSNGDLVSPCRLETEFVFSPVKLTKVTSTLPLPPNLSSVKDDAAPILSSNQLQSAIPNFLSNRPYPSPDCGTFLSLASDNVGDLKNSTPLISKSAVDPVENLKKIEGVELKEKCKSMMKKLEDGSHQCLKCGYTNKRKSKVKHHTEIHILPCVRHVCDLCNRSFKNLNSLRSHKYIKHKEIKDQPDKQILDKIKVEQLEPNKYVEADESEFKAMEITNISSSDMKTKTSSGMNFQSRDGVPRIQERWITAAQTGDINVDQAQITAPANGVEGVTERESRGDVIDPLADGCFPHELTQGTTQVNKTCPETDEDMHTNIDVLLGGVSRVNERETVDSVKWDELMDKNSRAGKIELMLKTTEFPVIDGSCDRIKMTQGDPMGYEDLISGQEEVSNYCEETGNESGEAGDVNVFDPMEF